MFANNNEVANVSNQHEGQEFRQQTEKNMGLISASAKGLQKEISHVQPPTLRSRESTSDEPECKIKLHPQSVTLAYNQPTKKTEKDISGIGQVLLDPNTTLTLGLEPHSHKLPLESSNFKGTLPEKHNIAIKPSLDGLQTQLQEEPGTPKLEGFENLRVTTTRADRRGSDSSFQGHFSPPHIDADTSSPLLQNLQTLVDTGNFFCGGSPKVAGKYVKETGGSGQGTTHGCSPGQLISPKIAQSQKNLTPQNRSLIENANSANQTSNQAAGCRSGQTGAKYAHASSGHITTPNQPHQAPTSAAGAIQTPTGQQPATNGGTNNSLHQFVASSQQLPSQSNLLSTTLMTSAEHPPTLPVKKQVLGSILGQASTSAVMGMQGKTAGQYEDYSNHEDLIGEGGYAENGLIMESLKVSTIHDNSAMVIERMNPNDLLDYDSQLLSEHRQNTTRYREYQGMNQKAYKRGEHVTSGQVTTDPGLTTDDTPNQAEEYHHIHEWIAGFEEVYRNKYLQDVLFENWREEGIKQMNLRQAAEVAALQRLHKEQRRYFDTEWAKRQEIVNSIKRRMRKVNNPEIPAKAAEFIEQESVSQILENESCSIRSQEASLKDAMMSHTQLAENLSRINKKIDVEPKDDTESNQFLADMVQIEPRRPNGQVQDHTHPKKCIQTGLHPNLGDDPHAQGQKQLISSNVGTSSNSPINKSASFIQPSGLPVLEDQEALDPPLGSSTHYTQTRATVPAHGDLAPSLSAKNSRPPLAAKLIQNQSQPKPVPLLPLHKLLRTESQPPDDPLKLDISAGHFPKQINTQRLANEKRVPPKNSFEAPPSLKCTLGSPRFAPAETQPDSNLRPLEELLEMRVTIDYNIGPSSSKERNSEVLLVQRCLCTLNKENQLSANGIYASFTTRLVKLFQESRGLPVQGIVDPETWKHLREATLKELQAKSELSRSQKAKEHLLPWKNFDRK